MFDYQEYLVRHTIENILWAARGYDYDSRDTQINQAVHKLESLLHKPTPYVLADKARKVIAAWWAYDLTTLINMEVY